MNRYRIVAKVPKNKARGGKGSRLVERIIKTIPNKDSVQVKVRMLPIKDPTKAFSGANWLPNLPKRGIYYEITWKEPTA